MNDIRERRAAENENLFRRVNERVEELSRGLDELSLVCECARPDCVERLPAVSTAAYEAVRSNPDWFFVARGHGLRELETIVEEHDGYLVVAKQGAAGEVARADDPRSS